MVQQLRVKERSVQRHHGQPSHHPALALQRFEPSTRLNLSPNSEVAGGYDEG